MDRKEPTQFYISYTITLSFAKLFYYYYSIKISLHLISTLCLSTQFSPSFPVPCFPPFLFYSLWNETFNPNYLFITLL